MTDHDMDVRLRAAGERWREQNTSAIVEDSPEDELLVQLPPPRRSRTRWLTAASAAVVAAALVVGGVLVTRHHDTTSGRESAASPTQLTGRIWTVPGSRASLVFGSDGSYSVNNGCVASGGRATISGATIDFGSRQVPAIGCVANGASVDAGAVDAAVSGTVRWSITGSTLRLTGVSGASVQFQAGDPVAQLQGTDWRLTSLIDGSGNARSPLGNVHFGIDRSGRLTANDQCGETISGTAAVHESTFTIQGGARTGIGCTDQGLAAAAVVVDNVLSSATVSWVVLGDQLTLSAPGYAGSLVFSPAAAAERTTLADSTWSLTAMEYRTDGGASSSVSANPAVNPVTLTFTGTTFTLGDSCYEVTGKVAFDTGTMTLSGVHGGDRPNVRCAADPARVNEEANLGKLFSTGVLGWTVVNGSLGVTHYNITGNFSERDSTTTALTRGPWTLSGTETDHGSSGSGNSVVTKSDLTFTAGGRFTLAHRCYSHAGRYTVHGSTITFSAVALTNAVPCASNAESAGGQQENDFVDAVLGNGSATFTIDGGGLEITRGGHKADFTS